MYCLSKAEFVTSILINCLVGKCPFPAPNGHHHERDINVFSILSTLWHCLCGPPGPVFPAKAAFHGRPKKPAAPTVKAATSWSCRGWPWGEAVLTIYAPMIYTAPCIMFCMRAYPLRGHVGGSWALEFESLLGPVKWHGADRRVPFGAQNNRIQNVMHMAEYFIGA